ncbi:hypothetical protein [Selenomonas sp. oral taxon 136]|uniref:hypothetical protein n=1 Tax=Selenomonas sp. oral taxon 136 TaxID=713030 RepID=UPI0007684CBA|nr:hypothetical protein [Selenomonas sp. oral taxon 136]AME04278.1 hypothetical protein AXE86_09425 [Selenomonas sp. oral taxon 136]
MHYVFPSHKDAEGQISTSSSGHGGAKALEKHLYDLIDGGLTPPPPAPTIRSPELQNITRLIAQFAQKQRETLTELSLDINKSVAETVHASVQLNELARENRTVETNVKELVDVVSSMANDIVHLAEVVSETADQTGVGKESMDLTQTRIHEVAKDTDAA